MRARRARDTVAPDYRGQGGKERAAVRCREIMDLLADYVEGALPPDVTTALESHLADCSPCIAFVNTYRGTINAARKIREVEIPPELEERLLSFLRRKRPSGPPGLPGA